MNIDLGDLNWIAIVVIAIGGFALGAGWYGAFAKPWMRLTGLTDEKLKAMPKSQSMMSYGLAGLTSLLSTFSLAVLVQVAGASDAIDGLVIGLFAGIGISALTHLPNYLFEDRPVGLWLINAGYPIVYLGVGGLILGVWT